MLTEFTPSNAQVVDGCGASFELSVDPAKWQVDASRVVPTVPGSYPVIYNYKDDYGIPAKPVVNWVHFDPCASSLTFEDETDPVRYVRVSSTPSFAQYIHKLPYEDLPKGTELAVKRGICYLKENQQLDGSWRLSAYPPNDQFLVGTTALATLALLKNGAKPDDIHVLRALEFLSAQQHEDGKFGQDVISFTTSLATSWTHETALSMLALLASKDPAYHEQIARASAYLLSKQRTKSNYPDLFVGEPFEALWETILGGWGRIFTNRDGEVNMNSTFWALAALDRAFSTDPALTNLVHPLTWTQPALTVLDYHQKWFSPGGFFESTDLVNPFGPISLTDHGRPTAAGLYANLICGRGLGASQVQGALSWLGENFRRYGHPQSDYGTNGSITYRTLGMDYYYAYCLTLQRH